MAKRRKKKAIASAIDADTEKLKADIKKQLAAVAPKIREIFRSAEQQRTASQQASAALDRAMRDPTGLIPYFENKQQKKQQKKKPVGRPVDYDVPGIRAAADSYITTYGAPKTLTLFREKVTDRLTELRILVPGDTRLKQLLSPIWNRAKRKRAAAK